MFIVIIKQYNIKHAKQILQKNELQSIYKINL